MAEPIKRVYENFKGVDFANDTVSLNRSPDCKNVYKDYTSDIGKAIETRLGILKSFKATGKIYGFYFFEQSSGLKVIVHCGTKLYKWNNYPTANTESSHITELYSGMNASKSSFFVYNDNLYIKDGLHYLVYDGSTCVTVTGFVPTEYIGRSPSGGGTFYQAINLISPYRYNSIVGDGTTTLYQLSALLLDEETPQIWINDVEVTTGFTIDYTLGQITFSEAPSEPIGTADNVLIKFKKTISGYEDRVNKCNLITEFDHRIFISGNITYPNYLFHSELDDPTYFKDTAYYPDGVDKNAIKKMVVGDTELWAIKENAQQRPTIYYHTPTIDDEEGKIYPSKSSKVSTGCYSDAINFNDDIVFLSQEGLKGINGAIDSEQLLGDRSSLVNPKLINEDDYDEAQLQEWRGYLVCLVNGHIYLADSRQVYQGITGYEYEWYYWDNIGLYDSENVFKKACLIKEYRGKLFIGTEDGYIAEFTGLNDDNKKIVSYWTTPKDTFEYSNRIKTTNKRGGLAKLKGIKGKCKLAVNTGNFFVTNNSYMTTEYTDYVLYKIKEKKWIDIQLKFYSDEINKPFGLYSATLEAFVGSYVKRVK